MRVAVATFALQKSTTENLTNKWISSFFLSNVSFPFSLEINSIQRISSRNMNQIENQK